MLRADGVRAASNFLQRMGQAQAAIYKIVVDVHVGGFGSVQTCRLID